MLNIWKWWTWARITVSKTFDNQHSQESLGKFFRPLQWSVFARFLFSLFPMYVSFSVCFCCVFFHPALECEELWGSHLDTCLCARVCPLPSNRCCLCAVLPSHAHPHCLQHESEDAGDLVLGKFISHIHTVNVWCGLLLDYCRAFSLRQKQQIKEKDHHNQDHFNQNCKQFAEVKIKKYSLHCLRKLVKMYWNIANSSNFKLGKWRKKLNFSH